MLKIDVLSPAILGTMAATGFGASGAALAVIFVMIILVIGFGQLAALSALKTDTQPLPSESPLRFEMHEISIVSPPGATEPAENAVRRRAMAND